MQNWPEKPKRLKALAAPPPLPLQITIPSDRPAAVQGAERGKADPFDGEDRSEIIWREGKGTPSRHFDFVWFSSLPAGINTDDSDPLWGRVEACNNAIYAGPHDPPHFFGGALSSSPIFLDRHGVVRLVGDNYRRFREIRKICCGTPIG